MLFSRLFISCYDITKCWWMNSNQIPHWFWATKLKVSLLHSFFLLLRPTLVADGGRTCDLLHIEATAVVKHSSRFLHKAFECVDMVTIERWNSKQSIQNISRLKFIGSVLHSLRCFIHAKDNLVHGVYYIYCRLYIQWIEDRVWGVTS